MDSDETPETSDTYRPVTRRTYLAGAAAAGVAGLAGCASSDGGDGATGQLATQVTDQPGDIADFESCVITITGMWLGPQQGEGDGDEEMDGEDETADDGSADDGSADEEEMDGEDDQMDGDEEEMDDGEDEEGGRTYYEYDEPQEADLVDLQGEQTQLVDDRELDVGTHTYLQLEVDGVDATLEGGESAEVQVPGNAPLTFNEHFEIRENTRTLFTADFTPVKRGQTGRYNLQPVPSGITVEYEEIESQDDESDGDESDADDNETTAGYSL